MRLPAVCCQSRLRRGVHHHRSFRMASRWRRIRRSRWKAFPAHRPGAGRPGSLGGAGEGAVNVALLGIRRPVRAVETYAGSRRRSPALARSPARAAACRVPRCRLSLLLLCRRGGALPGTVLPVRAVGSGEGLRRAGVEIMRVSVSAGCVSAGCVRPAVPSGQDLLLTGGLFHDGSAFDTDGSARSPR